jgi:hypothetical protein
LFREFADLHPSARVIGTDLSPIQPTWVPPNVQFEVDDCTDEWVHEKDSFDYIHIRGMYGSIADWDALYKTIYRSVLPPFQTYITQRDRLLAFSQIATTRSNLG